MARISVPCDDELYRQLQTVFPWGTLAPTVRKVLAALIEQIQRDGVSVIDELLSNSYDPLPRRKGKVK